MPDGQMAEGATPSAEPTAEGLRGKALAMLTRREHSLAELRARLLELGGRPALVEQVLAELVERNLQSDARFAEVFVRSRAERGYGPRVIAAELKARGVAGETVDEIMAGSGYEWVRQAVTVRQRRFGQELPRESRERARQMRFLQYRGFSGEQVGRALRADALDES